MNAYLDERFPTLAAVSELVDGEAARIEALKEKRQSYRLQQEAEAGERRLKQQEQNSRRIRAAIDREIVPTSQFAPEIAHKIENIRKLKLHQRVLELALDAATYLKDPDTNAFNLASVLASLAQLGEPDALALDIHSQVLQKWWQPRMDKYCAELRSVLLAAGWPRSNPAAGSVTVNEALKTCLDFELDGSTDMQTFKVLAEPLIERIAFNFRPGQDTAHEDRPEWLFGYVFKLIEPHTQWLSSEVQMFVDMPAERLFRALSPTIVQTLQSTYVLDAHFVSEILKFASAIQRRLWVSSETVHSHLIAKVMDNSTLLAYLESEYKERATALDLIMNPQSGSHTTDFDADVPSAKPPFSAENSWQLIAQTMPLLPLGPELVTSRVQIPLVDHIFEFWDASLDAFNRSHSSLARAVGSHDADRVVLPEMPDLEYLSQVLGAVAYFVVNLETLASQLDIVESGWPIKKHISQFVTLRTQTAQKLANTLGLEAQKQLRPYLQIEWREPEDHSHRLRAGIDGLRPRVEFISRLCSSSRADHARIMTGFANSLAEIVWRVIINANVFTPTSATELRSDISELWAGWSLPQVKSHIRNIAATHILETGEYYDGIQPQELDGLRRRRK